MMLFGLLTILVIAPIFAARISPHNGKKQIFRIDLVQFIYGFVLGPIAYIWLKTFLFYNLKNELNISLSANQLFFVDSIFSVFMIYLLMTNAIHSLTKTFSLRKEHDPEFDLFHLSEYFHLWLTHAVIYGGAIVILSLLAFTNLFLPFTLPLTKAAIWAFMTAGLASGVVWAVAVLTFDPKESINKFIRVFKLMSGGFFVMLVVLYFIFDPDFSYQFLGFWFSISAGLGMVTGFMLFNRSRRMKAFLLRLLPFNERFL